MPYLTSNDVLNARIEMIQKAFPDVHLEFSKSGSDEYPELYVYVLN